jgi:hypothetical protein
MDRDHPRVSKRDHGGRFERGQQGFEFRQSWRRGIHHQVLAIASRDDGRDHRVDGVEVRSVAVRVRVRDEDGFGLEHVADLAKAVHRERRSGRHEIDDPLRQAESRRDLHRARDRDDLDRDPPLLEEPTRRRRVGGGDPQTGQVLDGLVGRIGRHGGGQAAASVAQRADARQLGAGLGQQVDAGDPEVGDAIADELDDVVRPDEEDVELVVLDDRDETPVVLLEDEPGVPEQPEGRIDEAALVRDRETEPAGHRSPATG